MAMPSKFGGVAAAGERRSTPPPPALPLGASMALRGRGSAMTLYLALMALVASHYVAFHAHHWLGLGGGGRQCDTRTPARTACPGGSRELQPGPDGTCPDPELLHQMLNTWTREFHLDQARIPAPGQAWPMSHVILEREGAGRRLAVVPPPPHLRNCTRQEKAAEGWDERGADGKELPWARDMAHPLPPWVRGSDEDNLPGTRKAQLRIWLHQHPTECSKRRFLVVSWPQAQDGVAAAVHHMGLAINLAMAANRVLVPLYGSFTRARHSACADLGFWGDWGCYWHAVVSPECQAFADKLIPDTPTKFDDLFNASFVALGDNASEDDRVQARQDMSRLLLSAQTVVLAVRTEAMHLFALDLESQQHRIKGESWWGAPWRDRLPSFEVLASSGGGGAGAEGNVTREKDGSLQLRWWTAQAARYLLRWPKPYMCHLLNRMRHDTYGDQVAADLLQILDKDRSGRSKPAEFFPVGPTSLEQGLWAEDPLAPPYIPRPILSLQAGYQHAGYVDDRRADQRDEEDNSAYLRAALRVRQHVPNLRTAWVTTELSGMLVELQSAAHAAAWELLFSRIRRQSQGSKDAAWHIDLENGVEAGAADALANLVIASECDYFVGSLGSHWGRLIDELRQTNGHYRGGLVTLHYSSAESVF